MTVSGALPSVQVHDLTVAYGEKPVLWDVDLAVPGGESSAARSAAASEGSTSPVTRRPEASAGRSS